MKHRRWEYAEAVMRAETDRLIRACAVAGIITPSTSQRVIADNHEWITQAGLFGQAVDYRGASMCLDETALMEAALKAMASDCEILRPTALVVTAEHLELFDRYTWLMAQHGVCRAAFTEMAPALEWARRQAAVFAQWPALRLPASAGCSRTGDASTPVRRASDPA